MTKSNDAREPTSVFTEDGLEPLQKAEPAAPQSERFDDNDRRAQGKIQGWHAFQTP
jgi:hypothetical protein